MGWDASTEDPYPHPTQCWNHILESQAVQPPFWLLRQKAFLNTDPKPKLFVLERGGRDELETVFIPFEGVVKGLR